MWKYLKQSNRECFLDDATDIMLDVFFKMLPDNFIYK